MPLKIRELKAMLRKAGFVARSGKGSHSVWEHPRDAEARVVISGRDGDDAKRYQERMVAEAVRRVGGKL